MSYDLYLRDPVTREKLSVPGHLMYGGNIKCEYLELEGNYIPALTTEAYFNITYNYGRYYYEAFPGLDEDPAKTVQHKKDCEAYGIDDVWGGIRVLNGISGVDAVPILEEMIRRIEAEYRNEDGSWKKTTRERTIVTDKETGKEECDPMLIVFFRLKSKGLTDEEAKQAIADKYVFFTESYEQDEGETDNYWTETAANAIKPLYQLVALSKMRPDGVWSEES